MTIVAFEEPGLGSASDELLALGYEFAEYILEHCQQVLVNPGKRWDYQVYTRFENVPMYQAMVEGRFVIYAVEELKMGGVKISIMFAGRYGQAVQAGNLQWSGGSDEELCNGLLAARVRAHFR